MADPFRFSDPRQEAIYKGLGLVGTAAQQFFRDACQMLERDWPLATRAHLVGHCLREIESATRQVLRPPALGAAEGGTKKEAKKKKGEDNHQKEIREILGHLGIDESDPITKKWLGIADKRSSQGLHKRAHRDNLGPARSVDEEFLRAWDTMQAILLEVVKRLGTKYAAYYARLDALVASDDPEAAVEVIWNEIPHNVSVINYLFERLEDPAWLEPLRERGFFDHPYEPEVTEQGVTYVPWLAARYLARVADKDSEAVHRILMDLPDTESYWIHADLADAACKLPGDLAAEWAIRESRWIESRNQLGWLAPKAYQQLAAYLAESRELDACYTFCRALMGPVEEPRSDGPFYPFRVDEYHYKELLDDAMPRLVGADGPRAVGFLCSLIEDVVHAAKGERSLYEHSSKNWRRAIEEHTENFQTEPLGPLVAALRDATESVAQENADGARAVLADLRARELGIFRRVALHALRTVTTDLRDVVGECLTDRELFDDQECEREFWNLAKEKFGDLNEGEQQHLFEWIAEGPEKPDDISGEEETAWDGMAARMRLRRLTYLKDHLREGERKEYDELVERFGEFKEREPLPRTFTGGMRSPISREEVAELPDDELVAFLKTWEPEGGFLAPSPSGLGQVLTEAAKDAPERFSRLASGLEGLHPTYVHHVLDGLHVAIGQGAAIAWDPVVALCSWVAAQDPGVAPEWDSDTEQDKSWGTAHRGVLSLLDAGFSEGAGRIPATLAPDVWTVLEALATAPSEHPEEGDPDYDPNSFAHETTRSIALARAIQFLLWQTGEPGTEYKERDLIRSKPEVERLLDRFLDRDQEPSQGARAVFGQRFALLYWADREWLRANIERIFPEADNEEGLWRAAWGAYVIAYGACIPFYHELKAQYEQAVERPASEAQEGQRELNPDNRLAEHLVLLHGWGEISLETGGILDRFFRNVLIQARSHALSFQGQTLNRSEDVPEEIRRRIQEFVDWRIAAAKNDPQAGEEFSWCAWLFTSGKLDPEWTIQRLLQALRVNPELDPDHMVADFLCEVVTTHPGHAVDCLDIMVHGAREAWRIDSWRPQAIHVLKAARESGDPSAKEHAETLSNQLVSMGHLRFREVLDDE